MNVILVLLFIISAFHLSNIPSFNKKNNEWRTIFEIKQFLGCDGVDILIFMINILLTSDDSNLTLQISVYSNN